IRSKLVTGVQTCALPIFEREGYDVTYITDVDTHEDVRRLLRAKGFLSPGHDEYWSEAMKSHVVQARDLGVGLGFFGGNYMYWAEIGRASCRGGGGVLGWA